MRDAHLAQLRPVRVDGGAGRAVGVRAGQEGLHQPVPVGAVDRDVVEVDEPAGHERDDDGAPQQPIRVRPLGRPVPRGEVVRQERQAVEHEDRRGRGEQPDRDLAAPRRARPGEGPQPAREPGEQRHGAAEQRREACVAEQPPADERQRPERRQHEAGPQQPADAALEAPPPAVGPPRRVAGGERVDHAQQQEDRPDGGQGGRIPVSADVLADAVRRAAQQPEEEDREGQPDQEVERDAAQDHRGQRHPRDPPAGGQVVAVQAEVLQEVRLVSADAAPLHAVREPGAGGLGVRRPAEQPRQRPADVAAARDGREVVEALEEVRPRQPLQDAEREGGGPDAAARQRETGQPLLRRCDADRLPPPAHGVALRLAHLRGQLERVLYGGTSWRVCAVVRTVARRVTGGKPRAA